MVAQGNGTSAYKNITTSRNLTSDIGVSMCAAEDALVIKKDHDVAGAHGNSLGTVQRPKGEM